MVGILFGDFTGLEGNGCQILGGSATPPPPPPNLNNGAPADLDTISEAIFNVDD